MNPVASNPYHVACKNLVPWRPGTKFSALVLDRYWIVYQKVDRSNSSQKARLLNSY